MMRCFYLGLGWIFSIMTVTSGIVVTEYGQLAAAKQSQIITISNLKVPAGITLDLTKLRPGTLLEFVGRTTFGYHEWKGPLVKISGKKIRVVGKPGSLLDVEGKRWWDGKGGHAGKTKPRFMEITVDDSVVTGLNIKNPPAWCLVANYCNNLVISEVNIDAKDGDKGGAFNTDGFGVGYGRNVTILDSTVHNQDDCFVTGAGKDITVKNLTCVGGHGISIGTLGKGASVENVLIKNCKVIKNMVGIRIKTNINATGSINNVIFDNIALKGITRYGIIIHGNYGLKGGPEGEPTYFPIKNIIINNVHGTVVKGGTNIWVFLARGSGSNWIWNSQITGGMKKQSCKGVPSHLNLRCGGN